MSRLLRGGAPEGVYLVAHDIPNRFVESTGAPRLDLREGDVLVYASSPDRFPTMRGRVRHLTARDYDALLKIMSDTIGEDLLVTLEEAFFDVIGDLLLGSDGYTGPSRIALVRPVEAEEVTEPISAESDEAALFELLHRAGGRMPGV